MNILRFLNQPGWDYRLTYQGVNILAPTDATLRPDIWAILESEFERFSVNGQWYGQTTFLIEV